MCKRKNCQDIRRVSKSLLDKDLLTNGIVKTGDGKILDVHLELLASVSPFFSMLLNALPETPPGKKQVIYTPGIDYQDIEDIIKYVYTGKLALTSNRAESLIMSAEILGMIDVENLCITYLIKKLNEDNCIDLLRLSKVASNRRLQRECQKFILTNFQTIYSRSRRFVTMVIDDLEMFLRADELNVTSEENVFWSLIVWTEHDSKKRLTCLPRLLACVRFGFCSLPFYHRDVVTHPFISGSQDCQTVLYQVSMLFTDISNNHEDRIPIDLHHPLIRPRIPNELIFAIGGWSNGSASNIIETYDCRAQRWFPSTHTDSMARSYQGLAVVNGLIYMVGGFDGYQCFNTMRCYDPVQKSWSERACMYAQRCYISLATLDGFIYAMGGFDGRIRLNSAEMYNPETNQWKMISPMNHTRSDANASTLHGKIYIAGGFSGLQVLNSAEVFDPVSDMWTLLPVMTSPRSGVSICTYAGRIYVLGGYNGTNRLSSVEYYDIYSRQWRETSPMMIPRSNFAAVVLEDKLYVIGGFNGVTTVPNVECFNSVTGEWQPAPEMNINRSALAACVVKGLPNSNEYSFLGSSAVFLE